MKRITIVASARPNFMKIAPIIHALDRAKMRGHEVDYRLIHTGQHYDPALSGHFFKELDIPLPQSNLEAKGKTQTEQTAAIMVGFEQELLNNPTDLVLVVGDVTGTMACAIVAQKLQIEVAHVEAGIRSNDWMMPEEINRILTDAITNYFFTTSENANTLLRRMGVSEERIFFVGNTMIDTLLKYKPNFKKPKLWDTLGLEIERYFVITMHRPANLKEEARLRETIEQLLVHTLDYPLIFPAHPRTLNVLTKIGISHPRLHLVEPLKYLEFNFLVKNAKAVITDSGGVTEEASILNVPCLTLRDTTERPETISLGTNELVGTHPKKIKPYLDKVFQGKWKQGQCIPLWDGKTAERIINHLIHDILV